MKNTSIKYAYILISIFFVCPSLHAQTDDEANNVVVDLSAEHQTIKGWGASLCWWAHMAGQWDDDKIDEIIDLITAPQKLNMNIFRYNIGGGDHPSHYSTPANPGHMASGKGVRAEMQGFKTSEDAPYDWGADAGQRKIMLKIKKKRPDAVFEAFSNSPPYWMTFSGCSAGNHTPTDNNLKPEYYGAFCDYLVDVCKHYKERYGIEFTTLEPFNESLSDYWYYRGSQEGCHFDMKAQIEIVKILHGKLKAAGLKTVIAVSDETNLKQFIAAVQAYMADEAVTPLIGQLNTHTYSGNNRERKEVDALVRNSGKVFWQSETGPSGGKTVLESNLLLAQKCFDDLRYMHPVA
ncbi:MAG: hypothetical protein FWG22_02380 [Prolixibacteraceae bacterium]|nr:hypothetical protein [Prolixibacteraceae bacterium]